MPALGVPAVCLGFLGLALVLFGSAGNDDSHITYWSAYTLATKGQILSYNGVPLEQSSSLTLVLVLGLLYALTGIPLPTLGWAVSVGAGLAVVALLARRRPVAGLLAACSLPFLYWSTSGMEASLTALLLLVVAGLGERFLDAPSLRSRILVALALAGAAASRPEMPLLLVGATGALAVVELVSRSPRRRVALELVGLALGVAVLLVLIRLAFFGVPAPNPALMKSGGFEVAGGMRYLLASAKQLGWLMPAAALVGIGLLAVEIVRRRPLAGSAILAGAAGAAGIGFCLVSGGD
ncbi:hypothetical protein AKJ08_2493 [Vulgatibacter incomptus]|uniref:Glycosyltransferase RgtA/B/C/D-like domain-containing protein n=1 Tax=Vulgatibacter incomptus TaxID=1391653 RepID=A0A0K1PFA2_9BACT|nr:hypothetical protein AKJ08_2493 [Vulgatibacter incomptus]